MKNSVHVAIFLTSLIGITMTITLVGMVFQSEVQSTTPDFLSNFIASLPWAFGLSIVFYPCCYCIAKDQER